MKFSVGQEVGYYSEKGKGIIRELKAESALVEDEDGFDRWLPLQSLIFIHSEQYADDEISFSKEDLEQELSYRIIQDRSAQHKPQTTWEFDLHIEELLESHQGMSNTEILLKQMKAFRATFSKAKKQMIHKLVVIHGVGEGVLKSEIRSYLALQDQIEVYDADFSEYGKGATAIEFHPNW